MLTIKLARRKGPQLPGLPNSPCHHDMPLNDMTRAQNSILLAWEVGNRSTEHYASWCRMVGNEITAALARIGKQSRQLRDRDIGFL